MRGFYAILDATPELLVDYGGTLEARAAKLLAAGPCCLQLRAKGAGAWFTQQALQLAQNATPPLF